jgi:hypothetical protein
MSGESPFDGRVNHIGDGTRWVPTPFDPRPYSEQVNTPALDLTPIGDDLIIVHTPHIFTPWIKADDVWCATPNHLSHDNLHGAILQGIAALRLRFIERDSGDAAKSRRVVPATAHDFAIAAHEAGQIIGVPL